MKPPEISPPMAEDEASSSILEFLLRQPMPSHLLHSVILALPLSPRCPSPSPSPRLLKTLLLRRLAGQIPSIPPQTLDTIELIEQLDRERSFTQFPSKSLQLAYSAVAVDLTARFLKEEGGDVGDFFDAVNRIWNCRVGDLERSEAKGLASGWLREERRLMEEAVVNHVVRTELMGRETAEEARAAVAAYLKEAVADLGPTVLEMSAAELVRRREGCEAARDESKMDAEGNDAPDDGRCTSGFNQLPETEFIQEKNQPKPVDEKDNHIIEAPLLDLSRATPAIPTVGTGEVSNVERLVENQNLTGRELTHSLDKGAEVNARDINLGTRHNRFNDSIMQPSVEDLNMAELVHEEINEDAFDGNQRVSCVDNGNAAVTTAVTDTSTREGGGNHAVQVPTVDESGAENQNADKGNVADDTEGTSNLTGNKRCRIDMQGPSIMDQDPTGSTRHYKFDDKITQSSANDPKTTEFEHDENNEDAFAGNQTVSCVEKGKATVDMEVTNTSTREGGGHAVQVPTLEENGVENQNAADGNPRVPFVDRGNVAVSTEGTSNSTGNKRGRTGTHGPNIMDRNPTAHTYTWHDDSIDSQPDTSANPSERLRVPRPKRVNPVTNVPWNKEYSGRRKKKWWTVEEEDALRKAVDKYGVGNWSLIKNTYPTIFEDRTPIDLKDKWRNMTK